MTCKQCKNFHECESDAFFNEAKFDPDESAKYCTGFEPQTNADRIRAMSDEELANMVVCPHVKTNWDRCKDDCFACRLEWLKQPVEEDKL